MKKFMLLLAVIALLGSALAGQAGSQTPTVSIAFAVLTRSVDSRTSTAGQEVTMLATQDVTADRVIVIPKGSKLVGHIAEIKLKGQDVPRTYMSIVIDKAVRTDGKELPLQAIIAAVAAPEDNNSSTDPALAMMHSNEPKMAGSGAASSSTTGETSPSSKSSSGAAVATANLKGGSLESSLLNANSQGAIGYEGVSIAWQLTSSPPATIFTLTKGKNLKLENGTQILLRMAPPRVG